MKKTLPILLFTIFPLKSFAAKGCQRILYFNMPIIISDKIFNDQVEICKVKNKLEGRLTVPKRFSAKLENIKLKKKKLSFSITANEGGGKFQVFYSGRLHEKNKYFLGIAKLKNGNTLGPFVGMNSKEKTTYKIIQ